MKKKSRKKYKSKLNTNKINVVQENSETIENAVNTIISSNIDNEDISLYLKNISESLNTLVSLIKTNNITENKIDTSINEIEKINTEIDKPEKLFEEKTLIISYIDKKVILPFTFEEISNIFKNNLDKYSTIQDVVDSLYTKPLDYYKNSLTSRFKEAYKLIKERENGTIKDALDLAFEVFTNFNIHPAIISSCKTLTEFDIYLSCLEYNELEDFHFFNIKFIAPPAIISNSRKSIFTKLNNILKANKEESF